MNTLILILSLLSSTPPAPPGFFTNDLILPPIPTGATITNISVNDNIVTLSWDSNGTYQVQQSLDLTNWTDLGNPVTGINTTFPKVGSMNFFRLKKVDSLPLTAWAKNFGGTLNESGQSVFVDLFNNVYLVGYFMGTVNFGSETFISSGGLDMFLMKLLPSGNLQWVKKFGGIGNEQANSITLDLLGNIYVVGTFSETGNFGGTNLITKGANDCFVAKYSPDGNHIWSQGFGGNRSDSLISICSLNSNIAVCGWIQNQTTIGSITVNADNFMSLAVKFDLDGNVQWVKTANPFSVQIGGNFARGINFDSNGNIFLVGYSSAGSMNFGCGSSPIPNAAKAYICKLSSDGNCLWSKLYGTDNGQFTRFWTSQIRDDGDILVSGDFQFSTDLGGGLVTGTSYGNDGFIARYNNSNGNYVSSSIISGQSASLIQLLSSSIDSTNNFTLVGQLKGTYSFNNVVLSSPGGPLRGFAVTYNSNLSSIWADIFTGIGFSTLSGASGRVLSGYFSDSESFSGMILNSVGGNDASVISRGQ